MAGVVTQVWFALCSLECYSSVNDLLLCCPSSSDHSHSLSSGRRLDSTVFQLPGFIFARVAARTLRQLAVIFFVIPQFPHFHDFYIRRRIVA